MAIVTLNDIHVAFGPEIVLDKLDLTLHPGEKVGMVGANGAGKSTILKLITGQLTPDVGRVVRQKGLRIGYLQQETTFGGDRTVMEEMHVGVDHLLRLQRSIHNVSAEMESLSGSALKAKMKQYDHLCHDFEIAGGYAYEVRIHATLAGLGFAPELHHARTSALSGGQLSRLGLAQVLMLETDLLLLDEPTNHLDLQAIEWLERFLAGYDNAAVVISHDRTLLDKVVCKIVEVEKRKARVWNGNYSNYAQTKETRRLHEQREHTKRVEMVKRTLDFIARNKDQEGMRKTARGRKTQLDRLLKENPHFLEKPSDQKTIRFSFGQTGHTSDLVLRCEGLTKSFGDLMLFGNLTFDVLSGERIGITGPNGTGKSTLLRLALGQLKPSAGSIRMGKTVRVGYLDQHGDVLDPTKTVLDEALSSNSEMSSEQVRNRLGAFLFTGDDVFKKCADLSGGQRNRLMLCKLALAEPAVLVMDEPTNHLDIASREMLEEALADYTGTMLVVSHDRYFLDRVVDKLIVLGSDELGSRRLGAVEFVEIKPVYSHYASLVRKRVEAQQQKSESRPAGPRKRRSASAQSKPRPRTPEELKRFNKYSADQIEELIMELEQELAQMKERFGDATIYKNPDQLAELQTGYDAKTEELELLYRAYERHA
ncbi:MAG: ABC-F family ATP-binding cassette domain-containing protein [Phycisphaerales bacterium]|nr:MAG: ABC-F family ATP-binding cassette domain-containing protein [Phycisphaerales bacterium]